MSYFTKSQPNLLGNDALNEINNIIKIDPTINSTHNITDGLSSFYNDYIVPNFFFIFITICFFIFLYLKYLNKYYKEIKKNKINNNININNNNNNNNINNNHEHDNYDKYDNFIASFNPSVPVANQNSYTNYLDDPNNKPNRLVKLNKPVYAIPVENNIYNTGNNYTGTYNTYENSVDQNYLDPLNYLHNFNSNTNEAINTGANMNKHSLADLNAFVNNTNNNLISNNFF